MKLSVVARGIWQTISLNSKKKKKELVGMERLLISVWV